MAHQPTISTSFTSKISKFYLNNTLFSWVWIAYTILGLLNLTHLPIAWTDEIQHLDPVFNYFKFGKYASKIWPNPNANNHFLSYPPLIGNLLISWLTIFPKTIFFARLPFLIFHLATIFLLYRYLKNNLNLFKTIALLLTCLFIFDKSVFEISRSGRVETLINFLLILYFSNLHKKDSYLPIFALSLLALSHLYIWPLVLIGIDRFISQKQYKNPLQITIFFIPILLTFALLQPNLIDLKTQLLFQTAKHQSSGLHAILDFFWLKFWPYYLEQPIVPFLYISAIFLAIKQLYRTPNKEKSSSIAAYFIILILSQAILLTPQMRYHSVHMLFSILILAKEIEQVQKQTTAKQTHKLFFLFTNQKSWVKSILFATCLLLFSIGFLARHTIALLQYSERNPEIIQSLLNKHQPKNQWVIFGEPIADYCIATNKNAEFGLEFYPEHWQFQPNKTYFLLHRTKPNALPFLEIIDSTTSPQPLPKLLKPMGKAHTYHGLYLYKINNQTAWNLFFSKENLQKITGK